MKNGLLGISERGGRRPGFALLSVILALTVMTVLIVAFSTTTRLELASVRSSSDAASGFHAAEAGLNIRGELTRARFQGYVRPGGVTPDIDHSDGMCAAANQGSGDFACREFKFNNRTATTYVTEDPRNNDPDDGNRMITIPSGERFAGLNAIQYRYSVVSEAVPESDTRPEAILEMVFRARLVPLFQFAAFYDKDLEILPGADMTLGGPVHVNGDLYLNSNNGVQLHITGAITAARRQGGTGGALWRGRKNNGDCTGLVLVNDADPSTNPDPAISCPWGSVPQNILDGWNGRIETGLDGLTVPEPEEFGPGGLYWNEADVVVALDLRAGVENAEVIVPLRDVESGIDAIDPNDDLTEIVNSECLAVGTGSGERSYGIRNPSPAGVPPALPAAQRAIEWSNSFRDRRENDIGNPDAGNPAHRNAYRLMLEVDVQALMDCLHANPELFGDGPSTENGLDDTSGGGLVWYFTVLGEHSGETSSGYGVRLRNGAFLGRGNLADPQINGLTVVSDQALFIEGDYNLNGAGGSRWRPAAAIADAVHILSNGFRPQWQAHSGFPVANGAVTNAANTTVHAAFLSGTQTTGNQEGAGGQGGGYNGGLENYPTLHETWGNAVTLQYRGSFVSLDRPRHSTGAWGGHYYGPPRRDWGYDTRFNNAENLPPLSPRFVYLVQERFVREFYR